MALPAIKSLSARQQRAELMDQADLDPVEHARALSGLALINRLSRSDAILWPAIERLARATPGRPIRVLDVASGAGDVPVALAKRALRRALAVEIEGCDLSLEAVRFARRRAEEFNLALRFFRLDARSEPIPAGYDVVTCSLFLHHLDNADACSFLRTAAEATGRLLLVNDLYRDPIGYLLAWCGCRLLSRSPVVWHDGPVSVAGAFSLAEVRQLVADAGLEDASIARRWPRRFLLSWGR
jgi:SAM-dependent methyltransferase